MAIELRIELISNKVIRIAPADKARAITFCTKT